MNDYKELIAKLRFYADTADDPIYGICINSPKIMLQAADVIEQLVKERDAAVADLKNNGDCSFCKHEQVPIDNGPCNSCMYDRYESNFSNFEWRGVQER